MTNVDTTDNIQIDETKIEVTNYSLKIWTNNNNGKQNKTRCFNKNKSRMEHFWKVQRNLSGQAPSHQWFDEERGLKFRLKGQWGISLHSRYFS